MIRERKLSFLLCLYLLERVNMYRTKEKLTKSEKRELEIQKIFDADKSYPKSKVSKFARSNGLPTARVMETFMLLGFSVRTTNGAMVSILLDWYAKQMLSETGTRKWNPNKKYDNWVIGKMAQTNFTDSDIKTKRFKKAYKYYLINSFYRFLKLNGLINLFEDEQRKIGATYYNPEVIKLRREQ